MAIAPIPFPKSQAVIAVLAKLKARGVGEAVLKRVARLNYSLRDGEWIRGWHPADTLWRAKMYGLVGKSEFIRKHGRRAFDKMPKRELVKSGRRCRIRREAVEDHLWMIER